MWGKKLLKWGKKLVTKCQPNLTSIEIECILEKKTLLIWERTIPLKWDTSFLPHSFSKVFYPTYEIENHLKVSRIEKRMFVLGKMMVCLHIDLRWRFLYLPFSSVFWDYLRRKSYLEKWHWTISKNCTQLFFDLNRLKFSVGEVWYILKEIKICAGRILIGSKYSTHWILSSKNRNLIENLSKLISIFNYKSFLQLLLSIFSFFLHGCSNDINHMCSIGNKSKRNIRWGKKLLKSFLPHFSFLNFKWMK